MATKKSVRKSEQELIDLVRQKAHGYLRLPNVTSVGVGNKIVDGKETDEMVIQFTVGKKLTPERLALENITPLPESITADDGTEVPVDVIERSYKPSYTIIDDPSMVRLAAEELTPKQIRRSRLDTVMPGISVSHIDGTAGTFGGVVYDALNGTPYILSNWHVLNGPTGNIGDMIVQPGPVDDGNLPANSVGRLVRSHLSVAGDCAISSITGRGLDTDIFELRVTPRRVAKASLHDKIVKSGRTTGVTYGIVSRVGVIANIYYGEPTGTQQVGGFEIRPDPAKPATNGEISMGGDSGSLWMVASPSGDADVVLGLHFAGETDPDPTDEHALACNIHSVIEKLQVTFTNPQAGPQSPRVPSGRSSTRRR